MENSYRSGKKAIWAAMIVCILLSGVLAALLIYRNAGKLESLEEEASSAVASESEISSDSSEPKSDPPEDPLGVDSFSAYREEAREKLEEMTLRQKVGQVFVFLCPAEGGEDMIREYQPGGICLNAANFQDRSPEEVIGMMAGFQEASNLPLLTCCDEEGGTVTRISRFSALRSSPYASPREVYEEGGLDAVRDDTEDKALFLKRLGINTNLAPVADLSSDPQDFIYQRSLGSDPAMVSRFIKVSAEVYQENGVACTLKHFPGYGGNADTHTGLARDTRPYAEFVSADFLPFQAGIQSGAPLVLVSHTIVECMDEERPATLSPEVHRILREELGFGGLIVTDDLEMAAIPQYTGGKNPCPAAFLAGNDLLLCTEVEENFQALYEAVSSGEISEERLDSSVLRILEWKCYMGLL